MKKATYIVAMSFLFLTFLSTVKERMAGIPFTSGKGIYYFLAFAACVGIMIIADRISGNK